MTDVVRIEAHGDLAPELVVREVIVALAPASEHRECDTVGDHPVHRHVHQLPHEAARALVRMHGDVPDAAGLKELSAHDDIVVECPDGRPDLPVLNRHVGVARGVELISVEFGQQFLEIVRIPVESEHVIDEIDVFIEHFGRSRAVVHAVLSHVKAPAGGQYSLCPGHFRRIFHGLVLR